MLMCKHLFERGWYKIVLWFPQRVGAIFFNPFNSPVEHRPSTTPFYRFWASNALHLYSEFNISASTSVPGVYWPFPFPFALRVPCLCLSRYVLCWLPESMACPVPLLPSNLFD